MVPKWLSPLDKPSLVSDGQCTAPLSVAALLLSLHLHMPGFCQAGLKGTSKTVPLTLLPHPTLSCNTCWGL